MNTQHKAKWNVCGVFTRGLNRPTQKQSVHNATNIHASANCTRGCFDCCCRSWFLGALYVVVVCSLDASSDAHNVAQVVVVVIAISIFLDTGKWAGRRCATILTRKRCRRDAGPTQNTQTSRASSAFGLLGCTICMRPLFPLAQTNTQTRWQQQRRWEPRRSRRRQ